MKTSVPATQAASAATLALLAALGSLFFLIQEATRDPDLRPEWMVLFAISLASTLVLHFIFVAMLARRIDWSVGRTVVACALTMPFGSIVALILYEWHQKADAPQEQGPVLSGKA